MWLNNIELSLVSFSYFTWRGWKRDRVNFLFSLDEHNDSLGSEIDISSRRWRSDWIKMFCNLVTWNSIEIPNKGFCPTWFNLWNIHTRWKAHYMNMCLKDMIWQLTHFNVREIRLIFIDFETRTKMTFKMQKLQTH